MTSLIRKTLYRWSRWLMNKRDPLAPQVHETQARANSARKAHRKSGAYYKALCAMRTARLKQELEGRS